MQNFGVTGALVEWEPLYAPGAAPLVQAAVWTLMAGMLAPILLLFPFIHRLDRARINTKFSDSSRDNVMVKDTSADSGEFLVFRASGISQPLDRNQVRNRMLIIIAFFYLEIILVSNTFFVAVSAATLAPQDMKC